MLRLLDSGLRICSRIGVSRSAYNESYPEPDGRSGTHVLIIASPVRTAGAGLTKTDAPATYGLQCGLGFELYLRLGLGHMCIGHVLIKLLDRYAYYSLSFLRALGATYAVK